MIGRVGDIPPSLTEVAVQPLVLEHIAPERKGEVAYPSVLLPGERGFEKVVTEADMMTMGIVVGRMVDVPRFGAVGRKDFQLIARAVVLGFEFRRGVAQENFVDRHAPLFGIATGLHGAPAAVPRAVDVRVEGLGKQAVLHEEMQGHIARLDTQGEVVDLPARPS